MHHADKFIDRIIFLDGHPTCRPSIRSGSARPRGRRWSATSRPSRRHTLYKEARDHCEKVRDYVSKNLFEELIADEEGHIDYLETQLDL